MNNLTMPTIHLNDSDPQALVDQLESALSAIFKAREALGAAAPNARDYYPQGHAAYGIAGREHDARAKKLEDIQDELSQLYEHVAAARDAREQNRRAR